MKAALVVLLLALPTSARAAELLKPTVVKLADGSELIHVLLEKAPTTSLRWVVRSGGASDPPGKAGLAHLVEHLVLQGSYATDESALFTSARRVGAHVEAATTPEFTVFGLDAPEEHFLALMASVVGVVTNPALRIADLDRERKLVATEDTLQPAEGPLVMADELLLSGVARSVALRGSEATRNAIDRSDLATFYATHYVPSNVVAVVVGSLPVERVEEILERSSRLAPSLPGEVAPEPSRDFALPISEKASAPYSAHFFGYALDEIEPGTCRELAALLALRLMLALDVERPLASTIETFCYRLAGRDFLFSVTTRRSSGGEGLGEAVRKTFRYTAKHGPTSKERAILKDRWKSSMSLLKHDPRHLAEFLMRAAASQPFAKEPKRVAELLRAPRFEGDGVARAAKKNFVKKREVEIRISPVGS